MTGTLHPNGVTVRLRAPDGQQLVVRPTGRPPRCPRCGDGLLYEAGYRCRCGCLIEQIEGLLWLTVQGQLGVRPNHISCPFGSPEPLVEDPEDEPIAAHENQ